MTAVLKFPGRERATFRRPGLLAVPPPGPTGAPDRCEHWLGREIEGETMISLATGI